MQETCIHAGERQSKRLLRSWFADDHVKHNYGSGEESQIGDVIAERRGSTA